MENSMNKETTAMARARELNRTNEKRLSACIETMSKDVEKNLQKLKIEGESTIKFMKKLRRCSGNSEDNLQQSEKEDKAIKLLINPPPKMTFALLDHKKKKLQELSEKLSVTNLSVANEGNPVPVRTVHAWSSSTARVLSQKKPPQVARPTGRRRHSVESGDDSSDDDDFVALQTVKKKAGQKKLKELAKRRSSLPIIMEKKNERKQTFGLNKRKNSILPIPVKKKS